MRDESCGLLKVGDHVTVSEGLYAGLDGEVIEVVHTIWPWVGRARLRLPCSQLEYWHPFWSDPMDEAEWRTTTDTAAMERYLKQVEPSGSLRKWRLFAAACARRVWAKLPDSRSRRAVLISERYADGQGTLEDLLRVCSPDHTYLDHFSEEDVLRMRHLAPQALVRYACRMSAPPDRIRTLAATMASSWVEESRVQRELLRDIFGNPFCPVKIDAAWLAWDHGAVVRLAGDIYDGRRFGEMPILADALEDAGCADEVIIGHCRSAAPHARGCWLLDAILGKA